MRACLQSCRSQSVAAVRHVPLDTGPTANIRLSSERDSGSDFHQAVEWHRIPGARRRLEAAQMFSAIAGEPESVARRCLYLP